MAITKTLIKRMSNPGSVRPDQHRQHERLIQMIQDTTLEKIENDLEGLKIAAPVEEKIEVEVRGIDNIEFKLDEILDAISILNSKYENIKINMEVILADLQDLGMQVEGLKIQRVEQPIEQPSFLKRFLKWR